MIDNQKQQFTQFGIMADFNDPYITMAHDYEVNQLRIFEKLMENGLLSRQLKPVWWGCETQTALAEAELEYNSQHKSTAIYVKFPLVNVPSHLVARLPQHTNLKLLIWTSTPWTIPANKAVCVNESLEYTVIASDSGEWLVVAQPLAEEVLRLNTNYTQVDIKLSGTELVGLRYINPAANDRIEHPVLHGDHVVSSAGTGLVHTAPAHGGDDYLIAKSHGLSISSSVNGQGRYIADHLPAGFHSLINLKVTETSTITQCLDLLNQSDMIYSIDRNFVHSYPYDWRSKTPVIQRATPQWFVNVEKIKQVAIDALEKVQFWPESGRNRLPSFIRNRNEWCISRQRSWGVPLPIVYHKDTDEPLADMEVVRYIIDRISEYGTDEWFVAEPEHITRWLPPSFESSAHLYRKGQDTMDVWFDSGTSWTTLSDQTDFKSSQPLANVYLEGSDQHRGWFQSSLLNKIIASGTNGADFKAVAPFETIITHGFTLDSKNMKMSKSLGNVISPQHAIEGGGKPLLPALGTDGLRLWVASSNYTVDVNAGPEILSRVFENVKKLRVTFKYMLGNLNEFTSDHMVEYGQLSPLDKYCLSTLYRLQSSCVDHYKSHNFSRVVNEVNFHMNGLLSAIYFDVSKDCLYTDSKHSIRRRSIQTVLTHILRTYIGILAPIQPLLTQEVWYEYQRLFGTPESSPFMMPWNSFYQLPAQFLNESIEAEFDVLWKVRDHVNKQLDTLRAQNLYKNKLELEITLATDHNSSLYTLLQSHVSYLDDYLLVSGVDVDTTPSGGSAIQPTVKSTSTIVIDEQPLTITIRASSYFKCPRCWKHTAPQPEELCRKCHSTVHS
ncbi:isoleucine-tRNA ligase [Scheffersomyces amazonensis]|uniref:isoleucine-tRNA ligase n=1 Tax=Scheffersomyces amazonensis TaxID=1078765 RepID=UPI00315CF93B